MHACPGAHNNAWRRAEAAGLPHDLQPTWGQPVHCLRCTMRARTQLAELPELFAAISIEATHGSRGAATGTIGRQPTRPAWPGQAARLITDHLLDGILTLEDDVRDLRSLSARRHRLREGHTITNAMSFLTTQLDWMLEHHPLATEPHDRLSGNPAAQIHSWHRAATRFTARDERLEHHRVPCPRCELLTLFRTDGSDYIECRNKDCGLLLKPAEYLEHTKELATRLAGKVAA